MRPARGRAAARARRRTLATAMACEAGVMASCPACVSASRQSHVCAIRARRTCRARGRDAATARRRHAGIRFARTVRGIRLAGLDVGTRCPENPHKPADPRRRRGRGCAIEPVVTDRRIDLALLVHARLALGGDRSRVETLIRSEARPRRADATHRRGDRAALRLRDAEQRRADPGEGIAARRRHGIAYRLRLRLPPSEAGPCSAADEIGIARVRMRSAASRAPARIMVTERRAAPRNARA